MTVSKAVILIVDDSPTGIEYLNGVLGGEYEILIAANGMDGLNIAREHRPDLILLDVLMPGVDGYELCARIKADPVAGSIPVIFVTAMSQEEDEARGLLAGAIDYITKPISPPIVKARVRNHLELKKYRDFLENLSSRDGLTGIANRRHFDERLESEWRRARRNRAQLSLVLADIDFFKQFNDTYGHLAGDECLRRVAESIAGSLRRPADLAARYGGEEFACLLPDTESGGALRIAESLRSGIEALAIPHSHSAAAAHVTVSAGAATFLPLPEGDATAIIGMADKLLYHAKRAGRNRVSSMSR